MPERTQRYSEAERASQASNRRAAAGKAKYGGSYEQQGYRPVKEGGLAFLKKQEAKVKGGAFNPSSWQQQGYGSSLMLKAFPGQTERIAEGGGGWRPASEVLSPGHYAAYLRTTEGAKGQERKAFFDQHPELASRPGGGMDAWQHQQYLNRLQTDPATGMKVNRSGELYDPNAVNMYRPGYSGGAIGLQGYGLDQLGGAGPMGGGNMGGNYIPGYSQPFGSPQYGGQQNLGQLGTQGWGAYQQPGINPVTYATQAAGGSTFGSYKPQAYSDPFAAYKPGYMSGMY